MDAGNPKDSKFLKVSREALSSVGYYWARRASVYLKSIWVDGWTRVGGGNLKTGDPIFDKSVSGNWTLEETKGSNSSKASG